MFSQEELATVRRAFAKQIVFAAAVEDGAVEAAFAAIRREAFLGEGPWPVFRWSGYRTTPSADPVYLYDDMLIGLIPERGLNNGQPSAHAMWIAAAAPKPGEHVVHVGAGVGYYSAIMAHMVGDGGRVTAIEYDAGLAARARANFEGRANVEVIHGDGASAPFDLADVIYVNAGATRPADAWLDGLKDGGRLILPLTTDLNFSTRPTAGAQGGLFRITHFGGEYYAKWISPVGIIPAETMRDEESERALAEAYARGGWADVTRLYRGDDIPAEGCWVRAPGWALG